jgi:hypothetical protein
MTARRSGSSQKFRLPPIGKKHFLASLLVAYNNWRKEANIAIVELRAPSPRSHSAQYRLFRDYFRAARLCLRDRFAGSN